MKIKIRVRGTNSENKEKISVIKAMADMYMSSPFLTKKEKIKCISEMKGVEIL